MTPASVPRPSRRRMLAITAAACALPQVGLLPGPSLPVSDWTGAGLGTSLSVRLVGADPARAARLWRRIGTEIAAVERRFSLHRDSELTRLNRDGALAGPSAAFLDLAALCGRVHAATGGAFDPSVQPLWRATAAGGDLAAARRPVGWARLRIAPDRVLLPRGGALTFNGIAQGWAADRIAALCRAEGFANMLIDMGEIAALGARPDGSGWRAAIADEGGSEIGRLALRDRCLATSSPRGTLIGAAGLPHILGPAGQPPRWRTVAVSAASAAVADALSTAFCLMEPEAIDRALAAFPGARIEAIV